MKKLVYDLNFVKKCFGGIENMPILQNKSFAYSVRDLDSPDSTVKFYDREHYYLGQDSNSIGPYGESDFWEYDDNDGKVYSTDTPEVDFDVFEDRLYNVIVVRS